MKTAFEIEMVVTEVAGIGEIEVEFELIQAVVVDMTMFAVEMVKTVVAGTDRTVVVVGMARIVAVVLAGLSLHNDLLVLLEGSAVFWCGLVTESRYIG